MRGLVARGSCCINDHSAFVVWRGEHDRREAGGLVLQNDLPGLVVDIVMELHAGIEEQEIRYVLVSIERFPVSWLPNQDAIESRRKTDSEENGSDIRNPCFS